MKGSSGTSVLFLIENTSLCTELRSEAGLSLLVTHRNEHILFDTGLSGAAVANAAVLGVDLSLIDTVALSHGHVDHTGGLGAFLTLLSPDARIHAHPAAFEPKFTLRPGKPPQVSGLRNPESLRARAILAAEPAQLIPGLTLTGEVPRVSDFEDAGGPFYLDADGRQPDPLADDQSLVLETSGGTVVLTGCAHAGIVNILHAASEMTGSRAFRAVIGGLHMGSATRTRIERTIQALAEFDIANIGPVHCSGEAASAALRRAYGDRCISCPTGTVLDF